MDNLISRKAVRDGMMKYGFHAPDMTVHEFVEDELPSVTAVPLDKLCNLLHDLYGAPCNISTGEDKCVDLIGDACDTTWGDEECWKQFLTKWMEGLDGGSK